METRLAPSADAVRRWCVASETRWADGDSAGAWAAVESAQAEVDALAASDPHAAHLLGIEVDGARSTLALRAEDYPQARAAADRCLALGAQHVQESGTLPPEARAAVGHARVTRATAAARECAHQLPPVRQDAVDAATRAAALAELDAVADHPDPVVSARAVNNALLIRLESVQRELVRPGAGRDVHVQAWSWVAEARARSVTPAVRGVIVRQAVDLAFLTGVWERGWDHLTTYLDDAATGAEDSPSRTERVTLSAKGAVLAWERGDLSGARELGLAARAASVAIDQPWVRVYGFLGGVVAAAAGAGSLPAALRAYRTCTTAAGHRTRPHRAWEVAQVALDAGHPPREVQAFLDVVVPGGFRRASRDAFARVQFADRSGREPDPADLAVADAAWTDESVQSAVDRARFLLARARAALRAGRVSAAAVDLHAARLLLRDWPGRVLAQVDDAASAVLDTPRVTPAQARVLDLLAEGRSNEQIAAELGCSVRTVAVHVTRLLASTGARSRTELAVREVRRRLLTVD